MNTQPKTQARHAIELIADYHESHDDSKRVHDARAKTDAQLLDAIKEVLFLLTATTDAYINEKGNERQRDEIARLMDELANAKGLQTDLLERANKRIGALQHALYMPTEVRDRLLAALESAELP